MQYMCDSVGCGVHEGIWLTCIILIMHNRPIHNRHEEASFQHHRSGDAIVYHQSPFTLKGDNYPYMRNSAGRDAYQR